MASLRQLLDKINGLALGLAQLPADKIGTGGKPDSTYQFILNELEDAEKELMRIVRGLKESSANYDTALHKLLFVQRLRKLPFAKARDLAVKELERQEVS